MDRTDRDSSPSEPVEAISLQDLDLEDLTIVELSEETRGHPENLASSKMCCCCLSTVLPTLA